ncbi:MAG TPA: hypothetical protein VHT30_01490 [Acidimicrobiales bacterium]|jgi:hypothetical protein|nr:hypothetical protein [Acidimicrobiales bacterium]
MILDAIFSWVAGGLTFLLGLLPTWNPIGSSLIDAVATIQGFASTLVGVVNWADFYVPAKLSITLLLTVWVIHAAIYVVNLVMFIITKLHIFGGE